jgi:hypothetical protein
VTSRILRIVFYYSPLCNHTLHFLCPDHPLQMQLVSGYNTTNFLGNSRLWWRCRNLCHCSLTPIYF